VKNFKEFVNGVTKRLRAASLAAALEANRPVMYVRSPKSSKEEIARSIQQRDGIQQGLIAVLTCVEPCMSYSVVPNGKTKELDLNGNNGNACICITTGCIRNWGSCMAGFRRGFRFGYKCV
jgi:hypothetical protein